MPDRVHRILTVVYSQSGQTQRALDLTLDSIVANNPGVQVERIDLKSDVVTDKFPLPWSLFGFMKCPTETFYPDDLPVDSAIDCETPKPVHDFDLLLLAYPVWFMSPAIPVADWLRRQSPLFLAEKTVISISTSRKMWFRAQSTVRTSIENLGGRIVSHISLQDEYGNVASMLLTVYFFLTGRRKFQSGILALLFPNEKFGLGEQEFDDFNNWLESTKHIAPSDWPSYYCFHPGLVLSEVIGRRVMKGLNCLSPRASKLPWPLDRFCFYSVSAATVLAIIILMPPTLVSLDCGPRVGGFETRNGKFYPLPRLSVKK